MNQEIKLRYQTKRNQYIPEFSYDGITWIKWAKKDIDKEYEMRKITIGVGVGTYESNFYSDTNELFFRDEIGCNAFLGAAKIFYKKEIIEFENIN